MYDNKVAQEIQHSAGSTFTLNSKSHKLLVLRAALKEVRFLVGALVHNR